MTNLKKTADEHMDLYINDTIAYICPGLTGDLKAAKDLNSLFQKNLGGKNLGQTFEKIAKRVNKHLCKEYFLFTNVMAKVKVHLGKLIERGVKEFKVNTVNTE